MARLRNILMHAMKERIKEFKKEKKKKERKSSSLADAPRRPGLSAANIRYARRRREPTIGPEVIKNTLRHTEELYGLMKGIRILLLSIRR